MPVSQLGRILADLRGGNDAAKGNAIKKLQELPAEQLTDEQHRRLLEVAAALSASDEDRYSSRVLMEVALQCQNVSWNVIVEDFAKYSDGARWKVVHALAERHDLASAQVFASLVDRHFAAGIMPAVSLEPFVQSKEAVNLLFPKLLAIAGEDEFGYSVYVFALRAAQEGMVTSQDFLPFAAEIVTRYNAARDRQRKMEQPTGDDWIWAEEYSQHRSYPTLLLDLMGYFDDEMVVESLKEALLSRDPRVLHFAALSLLRHGQNVPQEVVNQVAASPEVRNWHYQGLRDLQQLPLFPAQYATQEAFAEANMVEWLIYPTELGRPPHEIELMQAFDDATSSERYFLFRFRTHAPHWAAESGWMAGLSGPFEISATPSTTAHGGTFSTFTKWDEKTPKEHFESISGLIAEHWKQTASESPNSN